VLTLTVTSACTSPGPVVQPQPVVMRRRLPPLLRDRGKEILAQWDGSVVKGRVVVYVTDERGRESVAAVITEGAAMPVPFWKLVTSDRAAGWSNTAALIRSGAWEER
jgi:hypothetical protein